MTKLIKLEVARFEHERVTDFKASLEAFLEGMISRQTEVGQISPALNDISLIVLFVLDDRSLGAIPTTALETCCSEPPVGDTCCLLVECISLVTNLFRITWID